MVNTQLALLVFSGGVAKAWGDQQLTSVDTGLVTIVLSPASLFLIGDR